MSLITDALKLTTLPQKALLGGLGAALLASGAYNVTQVLHTRQLVAANKKLDTSINDPKTGFVVRLTQAQTNVEVCKVAIGRQTEAVRTQSRRDAATVAAVQGRYDAEHAARIRAEKSAAVFLSRPPRGATLSERVADVDAQILGDLK